MKALAFLLLCFVVGAGARWFGLPYLSPPSLLGVLGLAALTGGGALVDYLLKK